MLLMTSHKKCFSAIMAPASTFSGLPCPAAPHAAPLACTITAKDGQRMGCETGSAHSGHMFLPAVQVAGSITAGDLAQRFKLATDLILSMVSKHLGTRIHARLDGQLLHTDAYIARIKARVGASVLVLLHLLYPPSLTLLASRPNWVLCVCLQRLHLLYT